MIMAQNSTGSTQVNEKLVQSIYSEYLENKYSELVLIVNKHWVRNFIHNSMPRFLMSSFFQYCLWPFYFVKILT